MQLEKDADSKRDLEGRPLLSSNLFVLANGLSFTSFQEHLTRQIPISMARPSSQKVASAEQNETTLSPLSLVVSRLYYSIVSAVSEQYHGLQKALLHSYGMTKTAPQVPSKLRNSSLRGESTRETQASLDDSARSVEEKTGLDAAYTPTFTSDQETNHTYLVLSNLVSIQPKGTNAEGGLAATSSPITLLCSEILSIQQGLPLVKDLVKGELSCLGELHVILHALHTNLANRLITRLVDLDEMELSCALSLKEWIQTFSGVAVIGKDRGPEYMPPSACFGCEEKAEEPREKRAWFCPSAYFEGREKECLHQADGTLELYNKVYQPIQTLERECWEVSYRIGTLGEKVATSWREKKARHEAACELTREKEREQRGKWRGSSGQPGPVLQESWVVMDRVLFQKVRDII